MINLSKYRKLSYLGMIGLAVSLLLSFAALWNSLLSGNVKHEGWVVFFFLISFLIAVFLFILAYNLSDSKALENFRMVAFEAGKNEIIQDIEKRNQAEKKDLRTDEKDIEKIIAGILSGIQGTRTITGLCNKILSNLSKHMDFVQGIMYVKESKGELFNVTGEYALTDRKPQPFKSGENLTGQVAVSKSPMVVLDVPEDYFTVSSGLGSSKPRFLLLVPVFFKEECIAVLELAAFKKPDDITVKILNKVTSELGIRLNKFVVA